MDLDRYITRSEMAALTGVSYVYIAKLIKSRPPKLIERNKRLDIQNDINRAFIAKKTSEPLPPIKEEKREKKIGRSNGSSNGNVSKEIKKVYELDLKIKQEDLKLKTIRIKKEELDLKKKEGKFIDKLLAKDVMQRAVVLLSNQYRQTAKQYLVELAAKYDIPDSDIPGIQKNFDITINMAVEDAKDLIKEEVQALADQLSDTYNVGEGKG